MSVAVCGFSFFKHLFSVFGQNASGFSDLASVVVSSVFLFGFQFLFGNYEPQPRARAKTPLPREFTDSLQTQTLACVQDFLFPISFVAL